MALLNRQIALSVLAISVACVPCTSPAGENWPQWRGPLGTGVGAAGQYPVEFSKTEGVAWRVALPGKGSSTPAVWGELIFVTCAIGESPEPQDFGPPRPNNVSTAQDGLLCYDLQGNELWRRELGPERGGKHRNGSGCNPSPATDGKHVVVYYKSGTLACFDFHGKELWKTNLPKRFGKDTLWWDLGTSPLIAGGCAIVAVQQSPYGQGEHVDQAAANGNETTGSSSYLVAFDLDTGKLRWRELREYTCTEETDQSYSTPQVVRSGGKDVIVTWGADHLTGHDLDTGKPLWECGGFNPRNDRNWRTIASATVADGIAVVPYGRGKFCAGIKIGGAGDITKNAVSWEKEFGTDVPTAIIHGGKVYLLEDTGKIHCLDLQSGNELWSANLPRNRNKYYSSPSLAENQLYCAREDGMVFVGQVSDSGYKELAANDMGERIIAIPVPIRGKLLLRGDEHLFCIADP